ncbi:MAG: Holliday junction branch migration protein RuvA [Actinobacteria bacterium]|nr:Holliday junction branch migration protein RuvA [Actinomycetota bacterium]MCL5072598.1 Holliday junction branch migration protein RuvA [Actinomycetota bacterium]
MIARLNGKLIEKLPTKVIIDISGIGFEILISGRTYEKLPAVGNVTSLNIYTHVREDEIKLIGFGIEEEKDMFLKLISVSGISVKIALSSFSIYSADELTRIILSKDVDLIRRIPGIGKKLAERMIVELKDKLEESEFENLKTAGTFENEKISEVRQALKALGYNTREIDKVIGKMNIENLKNMRTEEILKLALKEV